MRFKSREAKPLPKEYANRCPCHDREWTPMKQNHWHRDFTSAADALKHVESVIGPLKFADDWIDSWVKQHRKWEARQHAPAPTGVFVEVPDLGEIQGPLAPEIRAVLARIQKKAAERMG